MARRSGVSSARVLGSGEDPFSWAPTIGVFFGIRVRLHIVFIVFAGWFVLSSISRDAAGAVYTISSVAALFLLVLLHEFGHCFAARWVGGEATQIVLWPLGGLASVHVPHLWKPNLIVAVAGPAVNALLAPVFGAALWVAGAKDAILFNPLNLSETLATLPSMWLVTLFYIHAANLMLLLFNLLLPIFPMDGGRVLQAVLWSRMGWRASMSAAALVGMIGSVALGVLGLMTDRWMVVIIALFTGTTCWAERKRLEAMRAVVGGEGAWQEGTSAGVTADRAFEAAAAKQRQERERVVADRAEEDRILAKIASEGMESLTRSERKTLERATAKRRGE
ncbi:MAG: site-2 protease family protein [Phycisphaerales bacterium]